MKVKGEKKDLFNTETHLSPRRYKNTLIEQHFAKSLIDFINIFFQPSHNL